MYIIDFDAPPLALQKFVDAYIAWFNPASTSRTFTPPWSNSGKEFFEALNRFYNQGAFPFPAFRIYDNIRSGKPPTSPDLYGNILGNSFYENWDGMDSNNWFKLMLLPPFILNHPLWSTADNNVYKQYFIANSKDKQGIQLEKIFAKVIAVYQQWLLDNMMDDDLGVLNNYATRFKSTHYWAIHILFWYMSQRKTSKIPAELEITIPHPDKTMQVPYFPKLPVPGPGYLSDIVGNLLKRVTVLEKKLKVQGAPQKVIAKKTKSNKK